ncbi:MAG TPA: energy transducer TonB [Candidatus Sulfotelmatobacter sp.]|nr:energy transducer TonB [Candidatus Sulfotelmatobacter sp.]
MFESKALVPKSERVALAELPERTPDPKQRSLMVAALVLLLAGLGVSLYQYRDFWFPDTEEADYDQPAATTPAASAPVATNVSSPTPSVTNPKRRTAANAKPVAKNVAPAPAAPAMAATTTRTVLPPLEVEVVAGDSHRTIRPGSNSLRVDLQPGTAPQRDESPETTANVTNNAAERVQISRDTADVVTRSVRPGYPLLARQMKVQGSVILQALISKDGAIQDLRVVSGPPILASAAQDAVRQWHFKPHYQGSEAVETQAKITVNFTISTN